MAVAFSQVSLWLWGGAGKDHHDPAAGGPPLSGSSDFGFRETENVKFPPAKGAKMKSARPRRKWQSREDRWRRVDREFDVVLVPSDGGGCLSGSESECASLFHGSQSVAFRAKIGKQHQLPHKGIIPEEFGVIGRYRGQGRLADPGYQNPRWVDGELVILDGKYIRGGPVIGFVYWAPEYHFLVFFNRLRLQN